MYIPWYIIRIWLFRICGDSIGEKVYLGDQLLVIENMSNPSNLVIEDRVSIAPRVTLITESHPNFSKIRPYVETKSGKITIKHDSWIGACVIIFPGVTIGEYTVIGAGSIVTEDVEPYTIVAGNPAKVIRKLYLKNG